MVGVHFRQEEIDFRITGTHAKPLKNRKTKNTQKYWTKEDTMPTMPSISSVAINTIFLPFVSARHPHMYDPTTIPAQNNVAIRIGYFFFILIHILSYKERRNTDLASGTPLANLSPWSPSAGRIAPPEVRTKVSSHRWPCPCRSSRKWPAACNEICRNL